MTRRFAEFLAFGAAAAWLAIVLPGKAAEVERSIVLIECVKDGKTISRGTGALVSSQGHVLTARHVVTPRSLPDRNGVTCTGTVPGVQGSNTLVLQQPTNLSVDAALLRFQGVGQGHEFMRFCSLEDWMVRRRIFVSGFPDGTETGVPSFREGVLSTVFPNSSGLLETDGQTVRGMSGGPVFSSNLAGIVGIVIGADFAADGTVRFYGILPAAQFARDFDLKQSEEPCFHPRREAELADADWESGQSAVPLGVSAQQGICFLATVKGQMNDSRDFVGVTLDGNGQYMLRGEDKGGGHIAATARCLWFE